MGILEQYEKSLDVANRVRDDAERHLTKAVSSGIFAGEIASNVTSQLGIGTQVASRDAEAYRHNRGWVYASIRPTAQRVAGQSIHVGVVRKSPSKGMKKRRPPEWVKSMGVAPDHIEVLDDHPFLDVMRNPNELMTQWSLLYVTVASLEITAKCYWWIVQDEGSKRVKFYHLPSHWVEPIHTDNALYASWKVTPRGGLSKSFTVDSGDMAYFHYPDPGDPLGALSPLHAQVPSILADEAIQIAQKAMFDNGIIPGMVIKVGRHPDAEPGAGGRMKMTKDQRLELRAAVKKHYASVVNSHEPLILDAMIEDVGKLTNNPAEMDFMDSSKITKQRINQGFGVNPVVMGEIEGVNRASSAAADDHFANNTVNPKIELLSQVMTAWLGPRFARKNERIVIWLEPCRPRDPEIKLKEIGILTSAESITKNELRDQFGFAPVEGGDEWVKGGKNPSLNISESRSIASPIIAKSLSETIESVLSKQMDISEQKLSAEVGKFFARQYVSIVEGVKRVFEKASNKDRLDAASVTSLLFDPKSWDQELIDLVADNIMEMAMKGAIIQQAALTKESDDRQFWLLLFASNIELPRGVVDKVKDEVSKIMAADYWPGINETTSSKITSAIADGDNNLDHILANLKRLIGPSAMAERALMIAQTESTGAFNAGFYGGAVYHGTTGALLQKTWHTMRDNAVRPTHRLLEGVSVLGDKSFNVGGFEAPYPGHYSLPPQERINCRCWLLSKVMDSHALLVGAS